jgi:anti-sigma factor ChrR (cupin superfamily)
VINAAEWVTTQICVVSAALIICQQSQSLVQIGFSRAVGALDDIQPAQWNDDAPERTIVLNGQGMEHNATNLFSSDVPRNSKNPRLNLNIKP